MKTTKSIAVFIAAHLLLYFTLSAIGCMFFKGAGEHYTYSDCIGNTGWFIVYNMFIGWWISMIVAMDYYETAR